MKHGLEAAEHLLGFLVVGADEVDEPAPCGAPPKRRADHHRARAQGASYAGPTSSSMTFSASPRDPGARRSPVMQLAATAEADRTQIGQCLPLPAFGKYVSITHLQALAQSHQVRIRTTVIALGPTVVIRGCRPLRASRTSREPVDTASPSASSSTLTKSDPPRLGSRVELHGWCRCRRSCPGSPAPNG